MDTASKFTSPESILRFREGYSLYNGDGEDELIFVEPAAFVESTLLGAGDSARFDSLTTSELRNLGLNYEMKGTVLTHLLSARRDTEILEASSNVTHAEQAVADAERTVTEIKKQWANEVDRLKKTHQEALAEMRGAHGREIAGLRKKHADEKASLRTKAAILEAEVTTFKVFPPLHSPP
ncbi:hypothetical protein TSUD_339000 [Trifolium subterraneum]|nr:hypothetical protein TSUD_339000 [Trifolium subterraneum]